MSLVFLRVMFSHVNVTVLSGISNDSDYNNKTKKDNVWRNGRKTTPKTA